jgi:hypothetical protein
VNLPPPQDDTDTEMDRVREDLRKNPELGAKVAGKLGPNRLSEGRTTSGNYVYLLSSFGCRIISNSQLETLKNCFLLMFSERPKLINSTATVSAVQVEVKLAEDSRTRKLVRRCQWERDEKQCSRKQPNNAQ